MEKKLIIESRWIEFIAAIHPTLDATSTQYSEMRKSFYAGSVTMLREVLEAAERDDAEDILTLLGEEMITFATEMSIRAALDSIGED